METKKQIQLRVISDDENDSELISKIIENNFSQDMEFQIDFEKIQKRASTRSASLDILIPVVSLCFASFETALTFFMFLHEFKKKKKSVILIMVNPVTGDEIQILDTDTPKTIRKKVKRIFPKESFLKAFK